MQRPKSEKSVKPERLTITLANGQRRKIEAIARDARTSVATVIRQAVDKYVAECSAKV
jgi:predicted transcriptional regulator